MPEHLLDRDQVHAPLIVVGGARKAQRVRGEPVGGRTAFQLKQVTQPVADRAPVQPAAALIAKQRRRSRKPGTHIIGEPAQDQVQPVQHRHPPRPRPRGLGALAEPHVDLAERPPPEMQIPQLQRRRLLRPQARVIQRPIQRVIPPGRAELTGGGDLSPQELKELAREQPPFGAAVSSDWLWLAGRWGGQRAEVVHHAK
jgi:hypothetical protein